MSLKQDILNKLPGILPAGCKPIGPIYVLAGKLMTILPNEYERDDITRVLIDIRDSDPPLYPAVKVTRSHDRDVVASKWGPTPPGWMPPDVDNPKPRIRVKAGTAPAAGAIHTHEISHPWLVRAEQAELELKTCKAALAEAEDEIAAQGDQLQSYELRVMGLETRLARANAISQGMVLITPSEYDGFEAAKRGRDELKAQLAGRVAECDMLHARLDQISKIAG